MQRNLYTKKTKVFSQIGINTNTCKNSHSLNNKWQPKIAMKIFVSYKKPVLDIHTSLFPTGLIILEN